MVFKVKVLEQMKTGQVGIVNASDMTVRLADTGKGLTITQEWYVIARHFISKGASAEVEGGEVGLSNDFRSTGILKPYSQAEASEEHKQEYKMGKANIEFHVWFDLDDFPDGVWPDEEALTKAVKDRVLDMFLTSDGREFNHEMTIAIFHDV